MIDTRTDHSSVVEEIQRRLKLFAEIGEQLTGAGFVPNARNEYAMAFMKYVPGTNEFKFASLQDIFLCYEMSDVLRIFFSVCCSQVNNTKSANGDSYVTYKIHSHFQFVYEGAISHETYPQFLSAYATLAHVPFGSFPDVNIKILNKTAAQQATIDARTESNNKAKGVAWGDIRGMRVNKDRPQSWRRFSGSSLDEIDDGTYIWQVATRYQKPRKYEFTKEGDSAYLRRTQ